MLFLLMMFVSSPAMAYQMGEAPFCAVDNYGNKTCYYYDMMSCQFAIKGMEGASCSTK